MAPIKPSTIDALQEFLEKARRRLSDEEGDHYEQDDEQADPDANMYSETDEPDAASKWLDQNDKKETAAPEYSEYEPGEDEDAHQAEAEQAAPVAPKKSVKVPSALQQKVASEDDLQPSRDELAAIREYTRPWEARARDKAKLEAEPDKNPVRYHQGHLVEARNTSHADRQKALSELESSPDFQNADPITQMEMSDKFHKDWHEKNPDHLVNALATHHDAHKKGAQAKSIFERAKDEKLRHIQSGGASPDSFSVEEGIQHAGGGREDEDSAPSGISTDPSAGFARGNQEFLKEYFENRDKKSKQFSSAEDLDQFDAGARKNVSDVLGQHPNLKDPAKKRQVDKFVERYHPLIGQAARRVLTKKGLMDKANRGELDHGLLHEAGLHALFQAVNDYDHDHPSKAKFTTHLSRKMEGLMQTALKTQDEIPAELRGKAKKFENKQRAADAPEVKELSPDEIASIAPSITPVSEIKSDKMGGVKRPGSAALITPAPKKSLQDIIAAHAPEVQERHARVTAARAPMVRKQTEVKPKLAQQGPKRNVNIVAPEEGGEE